MRRQTAAVPGLLEKVFPDYHVGCKRGLLSDTYLPALTQPNVTLETASIQAVEPSGVRTADGTHHPADVIIYGTGFGASDFLAPMELTGRGGMPLEKAWADGAHAYYGLTVPAFPNLLIMYGPNTNTNTNTGGGSIIYFLESQARNVRAFVEHLARVGHPLEVKPDIEAAFDAETQGRLAGSIWTQRASWYRTASGRITANWPGMSAEYRRRAVFRAADYDDCVVT